MSSYRVDPGSTTWQDLYKAALFESDRTKLAERIAEAERAIVVRTRVLFHQAQDAAQERLALDAALYALHILQGYCGVKTAA
jgi:hypothetical protein